MDMHANVGMYKPISPFSLELDSVKLGVPSVHVGVEPSIDAGGVHASAPRDPKLLLFDDVDSLPK